MTYVKVQTTYATTDRDFIGGLKMVKAWEDWADDYNEAVAATAAAAPPSAGAFVPPKAMRRRWDSTEKRQKVKFRGIGLPRRWL